MLCPVCGFSSSENDGYCLRCGRELKFSAGEQVLRPRAMSISPDFLRGLIYLGAGIFVFMFFYRLYAFYIEAEVEKNNAVLLGQAMEYRRRTLEVLDN